MSPAPRVAKRSVGGSPWFAVISNLLTERACVGTYFNLVVYGYYYLRYSAVEDRSVVELVYCVNQYVYIYIYLFFRLSRFLARDVGV